MKSLQISDRHIVTVKLLAFIGFCSSALSWHSSSLTTPDSFASVLSPKCKHFTFFSCFLIFTYLCIFAGLFLQERIVFFKICIFFPLGISFSNYCLVVVTVFLTWTQS